MKRQQLLTLSLGVLGLLWVARAFNPGLPCSGDALLLFCDEGLPYGGTVCYDPPPQGDGWVVELVQCDAEEECRAGRPLSTLPLDSPNLLLWILMSELILLFLQACHLFN